MQEATGSRAAKVSGWKERACRRAKFANGRGAAIDAGGAANCFSSASALALCSDITPPPDTSAHRTSDAFRAHRTALWRSVEHPYRDARCNGRTAYPTLPHPIHTGNEHPGKPVSGFPALISKPKKPPGYREFEKLLKQVVSALHYAERNQTVINRFCTPVPPALPTHTWLSPNRFPDGSILFHLQLQRRPQSLRGGVEVSTTQVTILSVP